MSDPIVVVGAGHAAGQFIINLRAEGCTRPVALIGEEKHPPYQRPPLSKQYLAGKVGLDRVYLRPAGWYLEQGVQWLAGRRVVEIDRTRRRVLLDDGRNLEYSTLVLATGARPRVLPGADAAGLPALRGIEDADFLRSGLEAGRHVVLVGGGYIGLEVAATARKRGAEVTLLEADARVLSRVAAPEISRFFEATHRVRGVSLRTGAKITRIERAAGGFHVRLDGGDSLSAQQVLVGIGIVPNTELAASAGLAVDNGVVVDEYARTGDPDIYAIGDCANFPSALYGRRVRLESVQNAAGQARVAALNVAGKQLVYDEVPTFWSEQYDVRLNIVGLSQGHDQTVLRGDPETGEFSVFYLRRGVLLAVDAVNSPAVFVKSRKLVADQAVVRTELLADPKVPVADAAA
jgi:3-phenylpropionate/trans-cinnamate dioxygenase ferredoxin reductase subunit